MSASPFHFKKFSVHQAGAVHKIGTDGVLLGAWANIEGAKNILDIGTGTGLIALMLAQRTSLLTHITAIDLHPGSTACAAGNFANSPWTDRLRAIEVSAQDYAAQETNRFDLIVSNPPFFSEKTLSPDPERSLGRHSASLIPEALVRAIKKMLAPGGKSCLILPEKEGKLLSELAAMQGLFCTIEVQVRSRVSKPVERLLIQLESNPRHFKRESLEIYEEGNDYSSAYKALTAEFYLTK